MADVRGAAVLVTGGQRGLGKEITRELLEAGAAKVYVTSRAPQPETDARIVPLAFELSDPQGVAALRQAAGDVSIAVNNAGIMTFGPLLDDDDQEVRRVFEVVAFGPLRLAQAFAPVLAANGGGALVNILSVMSWIAGSGTYGAAKAALVAMTNTLRVELASQNTQVLGVQLAYTDTDLVGEVNAPKNDPRVVAQDIVDALQKGESEVLIDDITRHFKAALAGPVEGLSIPS